jgi:hypothetical protein
MNKFTYGQLLQELYELTPEQLKMEATVFVDGICASFCPVEKLLVDDEDGGMGCGENKPFLTFRDE